MKRLLLAIGGPLALTLFLAGCGPSYRYGYASYGPPPPRVEYYGVAPGPGYVWVPGYWQWSSNTYVWVPGRWATPPHPRAVWIPGRYVQRRGGYLYRPGHWGRR
jgi:hypothetical protein